VKARLLSAVPTRPGEPPVQLVPRLAHQGYGPEEVAARRAWIEAETGVRLEHVGSFSIPSPSMRGNVENPIGAAQVPLGLAGPLSMRGEHATGVVYVPLATTEGALVRSYERGMVVLTRAGGAVARVVQDTNRVAPVFSFPDVESACDFARELPERFEEVRAEAEATTRHGRLVGLEAAPVGREVIVTFTFTTGDAHGMNMIVKAADRACRRLVATSGAQSYLVFSGAESEKRASGALLAGGKGKRVVAGAKVPRRTVRAVLQTTPEAMAELWRRTVVGHLHAGTFGYNGHAANGLTALFMATGQDVANVANSAVVITSFEVTDKGDLYASTTLPSLTVGTVGGGTGEGSARECLELLGCAGTGGARKLAEIAAATVLAGEISMGAAIAGGSFVEAHETYGRNRPDEGTAGAAGPTGSAPEGEEDP
jgi:hydroxymethylglutaryl-CoA reductase (NADPH)